MGRMSELLRGRRKPDDINESFFKIMQEFYFPIFSAYADKLDEFEREVHYLRTIRIEKPDVARYILNLWDHRMQWNYEDWRIEMDRAMEQLRKAMEP